jgi:cytochrome c-type biogenesis protein CcsB
MPLPSTPFLPRLPRLHASVTAWVSIALLTLLASPAAGQYAPAGNAHPETMAVSNGGDTEQVHAAFGMPQSVTVFTPESKMAFAEGLDLRPLRALSVNHNGRVKILDTLASETVRMIAGKPEYRERVLADAGVVPAGVSADAPDWSWRYHADAKYFEEYRFDPLFTLLDMVIDPVYYQHRPLIGVDYLPLRNEFLTRAARLGMQSQAAAEGRSPSDISLDDLRSRVEMYKRSGRVAPAMIDALAEGIYADRVSAAGVAADPWRRGLDGADLANRLYLFSAGNLQVIAPASKTDSWHRLTEFAPSHPAREAADALGAAWRGGDVAAANAAIALLAERLPAVNPELYPGSRRGLELVYNQANAFEWGFWLYLFALIALLLAFGTGRKWLIAFGVVTLIAAVGMHSFGFITRCMIAERLAIQNQFESMTGLSLLASVTGTAMMLIRRQWLFGAAAAAVGFMVLIVATQTGIPGVRIEREAAILNTSVLLKYHVTTVLASYGLIALGFICSIFYLGAHYGRKIVGGSDTNATSEAQLVAAAALKGDTDLSPTAAPSQARLLGDLDKAQMIVLQLAFWTLGVGILLGAWWADHSWGRWWAFDPKETWALITWIVYLVVIHLRRTGLKNKGLTTAWLSVIGFVIMLWTYFGVNLLLPGLHAYA